jgi:hypothetical protein
MRSRRTPAAGLRPGWRSVLYVNSAGPKCRARCGITLATWCRNVVKFDRPCRVIQVLLSGGAPYPGPGGRAWMDAVPECTVTPCEEARPAILDELAQLPAFSSC